MNQTRDESSLMGTPKEASCTNVAVMRKEGCTLHHARNRLSKNKFAALLDIEQKPATVIHITGWGYEPGQWQPDQRRQTARHQPRRSAVQAEEIRPGSR